MVVENTMITKKAYIDLGWHIHERRSKSDFGDIGGETCGAEPIGGHYDSTFACGPATEERASCDLLERTQANKSPYVCEAGDLGGKFGNLRFNFKAMKYGGKRRVVAVHKSMDIDGYGAPTKLLKGRSTTFHCGGP
eukprot:Awhi_evm1s5514